MQTQYRNKNTKKDEKCKCRKTAAPCGRFPRATLQQQSRTGGRATVDKKNRIPYNLCRHLKYKKIRRTFTSSVGLFLPPPLMTLNSWRPSVCLDIVPILLPSKFCSINFFFINIRKFHVMLTQL